MDDRKDRRVKRTHRLLRDALMALIEEKGYDGITVQEIADRADVARSTFYLHFRDKDELLYRSMTAIYEELLASIQPGVMDSTADFEHVAEHAAFYRTMLGERGSMAFMVGLRKFLTGVLRQHVVDTLADPHEETVIPRDLTAHLLAGMQLALIGWWLENDMQPPAEEIASLGQQFAMQGLSWALTATDQPAEKDKNNAK